MNGLKFCLILTIFLLTSCGFHLRGYGPTINFTDSVAVIVNNGDQHFCHMLSQRLKSNHIQVAPPMAAHYLLSVENATYQKNLISVSSSTAARQYQLIYTVYFKVEARKNKRELPLKHVIVTRQLTVNSDRILGSNDEEALLQTEMQREATVLILYRMTKEVLA